MNEPVGTEKAVCEDIARRQALGIKKYGTTVSQNPLALKQWLQHHYEELLDAAVYAKRSIEEIENRERVPGTGERPVRYADSVVGSPPIKFGEPGYDEARFSCSGNANNLCKLP